MIRARIPSGLLSGGAAVTTSDTPPTSPADGALWWDSVLGKLFVWYDDGSSSQWVPATPSGAGGAAGAAGVITPLQFGAVGNGTTDDTTAMTAAIAASYGKTLIIPRGYTFATDALTATPPAGSSFTMTGGGTIKRKNSASNADLLTLAGAGEITFDISGITLDGNEQGQPAAYGYLTVHCTALGTATKYCAWNFDRVTWVNAARGGDLYVQNNNRDRATLERIRVADCVFVDGSQSVIGEAQGPAFIAIVCAVDYIVRDNWIGLSTQPVAPIAGKAGIVVTIAGADGATGSPQGVISGNMLVRAGHPELLPSSGTIGAIDIYHNGHSLAVTGNTVIEPLGRGIAAKSDALSLTITGNSVRGYQDPCGGHILVNASTNTFVNGNIVVSGNVSEGAQTDGIVMVGYSVEDAALFATAYVVSGNSVRNAGNRAIHVNTAISAIVSSNHIDQCGQGILASTIKEHIKISGNSIRNLTAAGAIGIFVTTSPDATATVVDNSIGYDAGWTAGARSIAVSGASGGLIANNYAEGAAASQLAHLTNVTGPIIIAGNVSDTTSPIGDGGGNTHVLVGQNYFINSSQGGTQNKTADFTLSFLDSEVLNNKVGSTCVVTLPAATDYPGREVTFINYQAQLLNSASANVIGISGGAAAVSILPATIGKWARLRSNDGAWITVAAG